MMKFYLIDCGIFEEVNMFVKSLCKSSYYFIDKFIYIVNLYLYLK